MSQQEKIKTYLQGCLAELNKLSDQIKRTQDYSSHAELILTLRELVSEQIEVQSSEDTDHTAHAIR